MEFKIEINDEVILWKTIRESDSISTIFDIHTIGYRTHFTEKNKYVNFTFNYKPNFIFTTYNKEIKIEEISNQIKFSILIEYDYEYIIFSSDENYKKGIIFNGVNNEGLVFISSDLYKPRRILYEQGKIMLPLKIYDISNINIYHLPAIYFKNQINYENNSLIQNSIITNNTIYYLLEQGLLIID